MPKLRRRRSGKGEEEVKKVEFPPYTHDRLNEVIDNNIHDKRARTVLKLRLCDNLTYSEIGENPEVDRTERQVGYILSKYIPIVAKLLK